jgi:hypothetical protein
LHGAQEGRNTHPLFDGKFYQRQVGAKAKSINGLQHYLENCEAPNSNPHLLFDGQFYKSQTAEIQKCSPLDAYLLNFPGKIENPLPLFDSAYYLSENADVLEAKINPLVHFVLLGAFEGRSPHPLFDTKYYLSSFSGKTVPVFPLSKDTQLQEVYEHASELIRSHAPGDLHNALIHYMEFGSSERRNPHPLFSSSFYLENHPEIAEEQVNPLVHFVTQGAKSGLKPHILFDPSYYSRGLKKKFDIDIPVESLLPHFLKEGFDNRVAPHPRFDSHVYIEAYERVRVAKINPLLHYLTEPAVEEHRIANRTFDGEFYVRVYGDVDPSGLTPLEHYVRFGEQENRATNFITWARKSGKSVDPAFEELNSTEAIKSFPSNAPSPAVTVILQCSGRLEELTNCLKALQLQADSTPMELIVADANHEEKALLESLDIVVRDRGDNQTEILNRAAREASGEILVFLRSNLVATKSFLRALTAFFEKHSSFLILSPKVVTQLARIKHVGYSLREDFELIRINTYYDAFGGDIAEETSIDVALRDSLVVRKKDFLSLSGFDENIGASKYQDVDLCLRAKQQGFEIVAYSPAVLIAQNEFVSPSLRWEPLNSSEHAARRQFAELHKHIQAEIGSLIK